MKKVALVAFNGEEMCFVHVLLNGLEMREKGWDVAVIIEGSATKLIQKMNLQDSPFHELYIRVKDMGLIECVCQACSHKMGVLDEVKAQDLPLCTMLNGHPSMASYIDEGYEIITF